MMNICEELEMVRIKVSTGEICIMTLVNYKYKRPIKENWPSVLCGNVKQSMSLCVMFYVHVNFRVASQNTRRTNIKQQSNENPWSK